MQTAAQSESTPRITRRVMLPQTEQQTAEAADIEDARKTRWGVSPSYYINLGALTGNRYTGYDEIFPRKLYRFAFVHPTGINEDQKRIELNTEQQAALATISRSPRTCAQDVASEAGEERVFVILESATGFEEADGIWDCVYPVEVEAEIFAMTQRSQRGPVPDYLRAVYEATGLPYPYVKDGHPLAAFIKHLEESEARLIDLKLSPAEYDLAEAMRKEVLNGALTVYAYREARLSASFGEKESSANGGKGRKHLSPHDLKSLQETGIEKPEDKPVLASMKMGEKIGEQIAERTKGTEGALADAVRQLAEGQAAIAAGQAQTNQILALLLEERAERKKADNYHGPG